MTSEIRWDTRMKNETTKAYTYLQTYLHLGEGRTVVQVRKLHGNISPRQLANYKKKYHWDERATQYDLEQLEKQQHLLDQEKENFYKDRTEKLDIHIKIIDTLTQKLVEDVQDEEVASNTACHSLKSLAEATNLITRLKLRMLGEPETLRDVEVTEQNINLEAEAKLDAQIDMDKTLLDDDFFDKQLEFGKELLSKR